jgi:hypothetical protein
VLLSKYLRHGSKPRRIDRREQSTSAGDVNVLR